MTSTLPALPALPTVTAEDIEQALTVRDLSKMPPATRVRYYLALCQSVGVSPLGYPFVALKTQTGELFFYATKECAEQLRAKHRISTRILDRAQEGELYVVTVEARMPNGRSEEEQGIVDLTGLKGQPRGNAMMRASSKAKRRATLALCGLGVPSTDEDQGHPVRLDWETGALQEALPDAGTVAAEGKTLAEHTADLYGDPVAPRPDRAHTLLAAITAVHGEAGRSLDWLARYWTKVTTRAGVATVEDLPIPVLADLLRDAQAFYATAAAPAPTAAHEALDSPPPSPRSHAAWRGPAWETLRAYQDDARLPEDLLERIAAALSPLASATESEAAALAETVLAALEHAEETGHDL